MLYLGNALLRYVLIYNLEVSFNFHLTFQQLNVIEMFTICSKNCFFPYSRLFSSSSRVLEPFSISLEGSSYRDCMYITTYNTLL